MPAGTKPLAPGRLMGNSENQLPWDPGVPRSGSHCSALGYWFPCQLTYNGAGSPPVVCACECGCRPVPMQAQCSAPCVDSTGVCAPGLPLAKTTQQASTTPELPASWAAGCEAGAGETVRAQRAPHGHQSSGEAGTCRGTAQQVSRVETPSRRAQQGLRAEHGGSMEAGNAVWKLPDPSSVLTCALALHLGLGGQHSVLLYASCAVHCSHCWPLPAPLLRWGAVGGEVRQHKSRAQCVSSVRALCKLCARSAGCTMAGPGLPSPPAPSFILSFLGFLPLDSTLLPSVPLSWYFLRLGAWKATWNRERSPAPTSVAVFT